MKRSIFALLGVATLALTISQVPVPAQETRPAPKPAAPTKEQRFAFRSALKEGRKKAAAGDQAGAIVAFRQALDAVPDDPAALSELGLAALRLKDYKTAEDATRKSIANASSPSLRGASLYNLGRLYEERGDRQQAIDAYVASLKERPNQTVREHLSGLDAKAAAAADPLAPQVLSGPFPSIAEFCAKVAKPACAKEDPDSKFTCDKKPVASAAKTTAPYLGVRVYTTACEFAPKESYGSLDYHLAVQTAAGWWFAPARFSASNNRHCEEERKIPELAVKELIPGGSPEVLLRGTTSGNCVGGISSSVWEREEWVVASIGPSGKPSATPAILFSQKQEDTDDFTTDDPKSTDANAKLKIDFLSDGQIEISGDAGGLEPAKRGVLLGKHPLNFP
jgi:tetratricopeptide (TPR) repeat protein